MVLVEPKIENKCKIYSFLLTVFSHAVLGVCVAGKRVKQTRGAGGTQVGAAGLVGEDRWALPFHDPRAICLGRQSQ